MGLALYDSDKLEVSSSPNVNPLKTRHDGRNGEPDTKLIYIRNDDPNFWYQNVQVEPMDQTGYDDTIGEYGTGFSVKLVYGTIEPLPHEWELVNSGEELILPNDIGSASQANTTTYYPVWIRVNVPGNTPAQNKTDINLRLKAVKRPVNV